MESQSSRRPGRAAVLRCAFFSRWLCYAYVCVRAFWPADWIIIGTYSGTLHAVCVKASGGNQPGDEVWSYRFSDGW